MNNKKVSDNMKILVTGAKGFVGRNLSVTLKQAGHTVYEYDINNTVKELEAFTKDCEFVFNLAGVNRPEREEEFLEGNCRFADDLLTLLEQNNNKSPIMLSSSIQAERDNPYGRSKKAGEDILFDYEKRTGVKVLVYRFPNLFGKWCRPNYNSAVATFCHNIARGLDITVTDPAIKLNLVYIDDLLEEMLRALEGKETRDGKYCKVPVIYEKTLGEITNLIYSFKKSRTDLSVADMSDGFTKKLYSTFLSYLPEDEFSYPLKMNQDERGSFTEIIRTAERGQFSVNVAKPGITKGNHWHHTKNEKFLVVSGKGVIRFRKPDSSEILEYFVSGEKLEVVDIPVGYTHNIENIGESDLVTFMWCNECFDPEHPDTFFLKV